ADNKPFHVVGPPTVADFDGDGKPEIAVTVSRSPTGTGQSGIFDDPYRTILYVFRPDGAEVWHKDLTPESGISYYPPPAAFDFDGDGAAELVTQDYQYLYVRDGRTGATRFQFAVGNSFLGVGQYPVVADVDNDGHAEIVAFASASFLAGAPQR